MMGSASPHPMSCMRCNNLWLLGELILCSEETGSIHPMG